MLASGVGKCDQLLANQVVKCTFRAKASRDGLVALHCSTQIFSNRMPEYSVCRAFGAITTAANGARVGFARLVAYGEVNECIAPSPHCRNRRSESLGANSTRIDVTTTTSFDKRSTTMASSSSDAIDVGNEGARMAQITINEGLAWLKTLKKRHEELLALRNDNAHRERRFYGASADKEIVKEPVYDVKVLDRLVTRVAREMRLLEQALKAANAKTTIDGYEQDDAVLGELA